jgi:hypothetical protein
MTPLSLATSWDLASLAPLGLVLPPILLAGFAALYCLISPHFHTDKQRAYILSTCSSLTMSLVSLPYIGHYLYAGLGPTFAAAQDGWRFELGRFGVIFFGTYLFGESFFARRFARLSRAQRP